MEYYFKELGFPKEKVRPLGFYGKWRCKYRLAYIFVHPCGIWIKVLIEKILQYKKNSGMISYGNT
jgi:hypothetical protein